MNRTLLSRWSAHLARTLGALLLASAATQAGAMPPVGSLAPDFTLGAMSGNNMRLNEQRGKVLLVNFWATWCGPCRKEIPHLNSLSDKYGPMGFEVLGVNVDDDVRNAEQLAIKLRVKFPVLFDTDKKVSRSYAITSMPSTLLIDRDGKVRFIHRGYADGLERKYDEQVRALLKE